MRQKDREFSGLPALGKSGRVERVPPHGRGPGLVQGV